MAKKRRKTVWEKRFLRQMRSRLFVVLLIVTILIVAVMGKVIYLGVSKKAGYETRILTQEDYESKDIRYKRGSILDCNGSVLAMSNKIYNLVIAPMTILEYEREYGPEYKKHREVTVAALKTYFGLTDQEINAALSDPDSQYDVMKKNIPYDQVKAFRDYCETEEGDYVCGVTFEELYERIYPNNEIGCHLIGFTVSGDVGLGGLEGYYDDILNGQNGRVYSYRSERNTIQDNIEQPRNGKTLVTSIDVEIQRIVQTKSEEFLRIIGETKNVSVLVMNPKNAEILALYNSHQYNPNEAYDTKTIHYLVQDAADKAGMDVETYIKKMTDEERVDALNMVWRNFIVSDVFEPGSTYKVFTVSGAIEDGVLNGSESFYCDGGETVVEEDGPIHCHNIYGHGMQSIAEALQNSCNDAMMQIAQMEGRKVFDKYQVLFGFGESSNIDLLGEMDAESLDYFIYHEDGLNPAELATSSFGQGVAVTMLKLATAFCSVINGGYYYQPHVVKQILDDQGNVVTNVDKVLVKRTISEETSKMMREILNTVVEEGTGTKAAVDGYTIGGKTGTAEKWDFTTNTRPDGKYVHSFIGFAPVEDPQVMIYCVVDEPKVETEITNAGGSVLFHMIAEELLPYMNVYKSGTYDGINTDFYEQMATAVPPEQKEETTEEPQYEEYYEYEEEWSDSEESETEASEEAEGEPESAEEADE